MKRILLSFLFLLAFMAGYSQMFNSGGTITVDNGATLVIEGDYTSTSSGVLAIDGTVQLKGDFINNSGTVPDGSNGRLVFSGTSAQEITGTASTTFFCAVEVNNSAGVALTNTVTGNDQALDSVLILTAGDLTLNGFDLTLSDEGVSGAGASKHIVTNGAGELKATVTNSNYTFPVGDGTNYNPLVLNEANTSDIYGVVYSNTLPGGWTGGTTHAVNGHWTVTEGTPGGNILSATAQWIGTQEQPSFDRTDCAVGVSTNNGATVAWKTTAAASGSDPYTQVGTGFTTVGKFMVGDFWFGGIDVDLDLFLAGPYSGGTMSTSLKTKNLIPLTDPITGTTVTSIPANTVDWIKVELRDKTNSATILYTKAFFLDNTGNVMSLDGSGTAKFASVPKDQYYIAVKHRNHLGAMTSATVDLTAASPAFNYKTGTGVFQNQTYTPMVNLGSGNYGLYKGNVNGDAAVRKAGTPAINDYTALLTYLGTNLFLTNVYAGADINLDGDARKAGTPAINDYTHLLSSLGSNLFILQQIP